VTFHKIDQNRVFAGVGYQVTKDFSFQGGFLYQMLVKANGAKQENNTGIQLQVNYNFDFTKKTD
jgi:predicted porin